MKVSIIVPVYKVEEYIQRCFDSIKNQTYTTIECIFVDDCSPDNCYEILKQQIAEYSGWIDFKILRHEQNKGLSGARNTGTLAATGEYIYYLDSDDEITPDCIDTLVKLARKYPGVEMVQGNTKTIPQPEVDWRNIKSKGFPEYVADHLWIKKHCFSEPRIPVNAWNKLIKIDFLIENKLIFKEGIIHEDEHWMFFVSKYLHRITFSKNYGYLHYIVPGSIMQTGSDNKSILAWLTIIQDWTNNFDGEFACLQKQFAYHKLRVNLLCAINENDQGDTLKRYRTVIAEFFRKSKSDKSLREMLIFKAMLLPPALYKNFFTQKIIGFLFRFL
ncbi:glycosyltransferase family 2 protein [Gaoshiqia sediminis]|uniref:Glycosyltransferase n=1 Tax=Gaoshiqia sediminis TaxID=2986998 RepID=A0AA41Y8R5_9BACT|nr:glycosyltransferase family 2 protein [Gaoshiqia sediminis]MCW0484119.1 glycosyltransferase [Gaoshiqia sediminis]